MRIWRLGVSIRALPDRSIQEMPASKTPAKNSRRMAGKTCVVEKGAVAVTTVLNDSNGADYPAFTLRCKNAFSRAMPAWLMNSSRVSSRPGTRPLSGLSP